MQHSLNEAARFMSLMHRPRVKFFTKEILPLLAILTIASVVLLTALDSGQIPTWDDSVHGWTTRNMQHFHEYFFPLKKDGSYFWWFKKPPIINWLIIGSTSFFGYTNVGLRLPFALMSIGIVLLMYGFGRYYKSPLTGLLFAFVTLMSQRLVIMGRMSTIEVQLIFFLLLSLYLYLRLMDGPPWKMIFPALALACVALTKQVMLMLAVPPLVLLEFSSGLKEWRPAFKRLIVAFGGATVFFGWWYIWAYIRGGYDFVYEFFIYNFSVRVKTSNVLPLDEVFRELRATSLSASSYVFAIVGLFLLSTSRKETKSSNRILALFVGYLIIALFLFGFFSKRNMPWYYLHFVTPMAVGISVYLYHYLRYTSPLIDLMGLGITVITCMELLMNKVHTIRFLCAYIVLRLVLNLVGRKYFHSQRSNLIRILDLALISVCVIISVQSYSIYHRPQSDMSKVATLLKEKKVKQVYFGPHITRNYVVEYYFGPQWTRFNNQDLQKSSAVIDTSLHLNEKDVENHRIGRFIVGIKKE